MQRKERIAWGVDLVLVLITYSIGGAWAAVGAGFLGAVIISQALHEREPDQEHKGLFGGAVPKTNQESLSFSFHAGEAPYEEEYSGHYYVESPNPVLVQSFTKKIFRVCVHNETNATLEDVVVKLESISPRVPMLSGVVLHQQHDNPADQKSFKHSFTLEPGNYQFVDVVFKTASRDNADIYHIVRGVPRDVPKGQYEIVLTASARGVPPVRKQFAFVVDGGELRFGI